MKHYRALFFLSLLLLLLLGCDKKKRQEQNPFEGNPATSEQSSVILEDLAKAKEKAERNTTTLYPSKRATFTLQDQNGTTHSISVDNGQLFFRDISQPVVIMYFFSTWSQPCKGKAPYLADLQQHFPKELFVTGILLHPHDHLAELETFRAKNRADFFISSSSENDRFATAVLEHLHLSDRLTVPLTVIYHGGHYVRHYEGAVPIEMIEHDIKRLLD